MQNNEGPLKWGNSGKISAVFRMATLTNVDFSGIMSQLLLAGSHQWWKGNVSSFSMADFCLSLTFQSRRHVVAVVHCKAPLL